LNFVCKIFKLTLLKHRLNDADPVQGADRDYVHYLITKMLHAFASNIQIRGANSYYVETAKTLVTERLLYLLQDDFASDSNLGAMVETYLSNLIQEIEPPSSYKDGDVDQSLVDAVVAECVTTLMNYYSSDNRINESIMVQLVFRDIGLSSYQYMYDSLSLVTVGELLLVDEYSYPILALINEKARSKDKQRKVRAHMGKKLSGKNMDPLGKGSKGKGGAVPGPEHASSRGRCSQCVHALPSKCCSSNRPHLLRCCIHLSVCVFDPSAGCLSGL
jgi:hypothetical protein